MSYTDDQKKCDPKIMCKYNINTSQDARKWILSNHADKGGKIDSGDFTSVIDCYKQKQYCVKKTNTFNPNDENTKASREKIYDCYRQTENWSKISPVHKLDSASFNPEKVIEAIHYSSPKLEQLLRIIEQVDINDMETHGTYFKHFIFSDVKSGGYGAKILAAALVANGYNNLVHSVTKRLKTKKGSDFVNKKLALKKTNLIHSLFYHQPLFLNRTLLRV